MMWTPNIGFAYPFADAIPRNTPDFNEMDTNGDGVITNRDDPYQPYYPGDQYVDWVGLSTYWYTYEMNGYQPLSPYFQDTLRGQGPILNQIAPPSPNFYEIYANSKKKPMAIAETGSPVTYNDANSNQPPSIDQELNMKREWWRQIWSKEVHENFPLVKLILNFEEAKFENGRFKDWRVTWNATILNEYIRDNIEGEPSNRIIWSTDLTWNCSGSIKCYSPSCFNRIK